MANPYDLTSGYLSAKKLKQDKEYQDKVGEYYDARIADTKEDTRRKKSRNDFAEKMMGWMGGSIFGVETPKAPDAAIAKPPPSMTPQSGMSTQSGNGIKPMKISSGVDFEDPSLDPSRQGLAQPGYMLEAADGAYIDEDTIRRYGIRAYNNGSMGGVAPITDDEARRLGYGSAQEYTEFEGGRGRADVQVNPVASRAGVATPIDMMPVSAPVNQRAGIATPTDGTTVTPSGESAKPAAEPQKSPFQELAQKDPKTAESLFNKVSNFKNLSNVITGLSMIDWADEKVTGSSLMTTVNTLAAMKKEGVFQAASAMAAGNIEKGKKLYKEFGDDVGDFDVETRISKEIDPRDPNGKRMLEKKVFDLKFQDGSTITLDPRRLALDTLSAKALIEQEGKERDDLYRERGLDLQAQDLASRGKDRAQRDDDKLFQLYMNRGSAGIEALSKEEQKRIEADNELAIDGKKRKSEESAVASRIARAQEIYYDELIAGRYPPPPRVIYEAIKNGKIK